MAKHHQKSHDKFLKELYEKNEHYRNGKFWIKGEYINCKIDILCEDKYGETKVVPDSLLQGYSPSIRSAIDKNQYFINQAREIHGDKYDYSKVKYKTSNKKIKIYCRKHKKYFLQVLNNHLQGQSCPECAFESTVKYNRESSVKGWKDDDWIRAAQKSKYFDSFKVYIIRCFNDNEQFYKIGRTFTTIKTRFDCRECDKTMPYQYEIIKEITGEAKYICKLERKLQKQHNEYKYIPKIRFNGMYECFSKIKFGKLENFV